MERDFKGVWIPKQIWLDEDLTAIEKVILTEIDSLDRSEQGCTAGNEYLAEFCQCSVPTVTRSIKKLMDLGYLKLQSFDGRHRELKSCLIKMIRQTTQNDEADTSKRLAINTDNNISNNTSIESRRFKPPTEEEVMEFCEENGYQIDAERFVSYYQSTGWRIGKSPMKNWKAAVRTWVRRDSESGRSETYRAPAPKTVGVHFESERRFDDDDDIYFDPAEGL